MEPKDELWRIGRIRRGEQGWSCLRIGVYSEKSGEIMVYHWIWDLIFGQTQTFCPTGSGSVAGDQEWEGPMRACILWVANVLPIQRIQWRVQHCINNNLGSTKTISVSTICVISLIIFFHYHVTITTIETHGAPPPLWQWGATLVAFLITWNLTQFSNSSRKIFARPCISVSNRHNSTRTYVSIFVSIQHICFHLQQHYIIPAWHITSLSSCFPPLHTLRAH